PPPRTTLKPRIANFELMGATPVPRRLPRMRTDFDAGRRALPARAARIPAACPDYSAAGPLTRLRRRPPPAVKCPDVVGALVGRRVLRRPVAQAAACFRDRSHLVPVEPLLERRAHRGHVRGPVVQDR